MKQNKEKLPWYLSVLLFSIVPLSNIIAYLVSLPFLPKQMQLANLSKMMQIPEKQLMMSQIGSTLAFSIIGFIFIYLIDWLLLRIFAPKRDLEALFISLVLAIGIGNAVAIITMFLFKIDLPQVSAVAQMLILSLGYYHLTKKEDVRGCVVLSIIVFLVGVLPAFAQLLV